MAKDSPRVVTGVPAPGELDKLKKAVRLLEELGMEAAMIAIPGAIYSFTKVSGEFRIVRQPVPE